MPQQLSVSAKESIVLQALNRGESTIKSIAKANNIGVSTLQKWLRRQREGRPLERPNSPRSKSGSTPSAEEQLNHLVATANLDELELGKYCRRHGIYSHQLITWREALMKKMKSDEKSPPKKDAELKSLKAENKRLQSELRRKEKALAEASALLVMKKKADLIWGESKDDR